MTSDGAEPAPAFVHETSVVDEPELLGAGTRVWHFCYVQAGAVVGASCVLGQNVHVAKGAVLGRGVRVQNNVSIYSGTVIEDDVFLGPSCVLTNVSNPRSQVSRKALFEKTLIQRGATIGANATVVCGVTIGRYAFVAAGAVVTRSFSDYAFVSGVPAVQSGWMSRHGHRLSGSVGETLTCPESGFRYAVRGDGALRCLDLDEEAPLPEALRAGTVSYRDVKKAGDAVR